MGSVLGVVTSSRLVRLAAVAALAAVTLSVGSSANGATSKTIRTQGTEDVHINSKIFSNLRFSPGNTSIKSGEEITLVHADDTDAPHTLTIVNPGELPTDVGDIFSCGEVLQPEVAANYLVEQFAAERTSIVEMQRGMFLNSSVPIVNNAPVQVS